MSQKHAWVGPLPWDLEGALPRALEGRLHWAPERPFPWALEVPPPWALEGLLFWALPGLWRGPGLYGGLYKYMKKNMFQLPNAFTITKFFSFIQGSLISRSRALKEMKFTSYTDNDEWTTHPHP